MRSFLIALIASLLTLACLYIGGAFSHTAASPVKETVYQRIMRTQTIRCGYAPWEPGLNKDANTGALSGPVYDMTMELGHQLGLKIDWAYELNITTYLEDLNNGKFDMECAGGFANAERGKFVSYSKPYFFMPSYAYVRADDTRFGDTLASINNPDVTIAVMDSDYSMHYRDKNFPLSKALQLPSSAQFSDIMMAVIYKKADVALFDALSAQLIEKSHPGALRRIPVLIRAIPAAYSIPRDEANLKSMVDTAIDEIIDGGFVDDLIRKNGLDNGIVIPVAKPYAH